MSVILHQSIVRGEQFVYDEYEFAIYLAIRMIMKDNQDEYYLSFNQIVATLVGGKDILCSNTRVNLREAFINMLNCNKEGYPSIKVLNTLDGRNNSFYVDLSDFRFDESEKNYTSIEVDEVHKILNLTGFNNKFNLLRYFCVLVSTMHKENDILIGNVSMETVRKFCHIIASKNTQYRYNSILYVNNIIYLSNMGLGVVNEDKIYTISNIYGRYKDKNAIQDYARSIATNKKQTFEYRSDVNKVRSLKQKIAHFKAGYAYTDEELTDLRHAAEVENAKCDKMISLSTSEKIKEKYVSRKIDMSIFN